MGKIIHICTGGFENNILYALSDEGKIYFMDNNGKSKFTEIIL